MSKILFTLAWYHDGVTMKPQFVISVNPMTCITVKGRDFLNPKITNSNANFGARNRFETSVVHGESVTRTSLVMNTSAILPAFMWMAKHPCGPPAATGPRGQAGRKAPNGLVPKDATNGYNADGEKVDPKRIEGRRRSSSPRDRDYRRDRDDDRYSRNYISRDDYDSRRHSHSDYGIPDRETRRRDRHKRQSSTSSSDSDAGGSKYRRSRRNQMGASGSGGIDCGDAGGDGGGGDGGGGGE